MYVFLITGLVVLVVTLKLFINWKLSYWTRKGIANANVSIFEVAKKPFHVLDSELAQKYKTPVFGAYNLLKPSLVVADVEVAKKVLISEFHNFQNHLTVVSDSGYGGESVFNAKDEKWRQMRNVITPTFSSSKIRQMQTLIDDSLDDLVTSLNSVEGKAIDIKHYMSGFTMDVIASCAFGTKVNTARDPDNEIARHGHMFFEGGLTLSFFAFLLWPWFAVHVLGVNALREKPAKFFFELTQSIVGKRKQDPSHVRNDFIKYLMETQFEGKSLTEKQIGDNGVVFFLAGHDTSSVTLTHVFYLLAINPDIQDKLRAELDQFYSNGQQVTYESVNDLKYLDAVVNETLRYLPTVPRIFRETSADCTLGDISLSKGTNVTVLNYVIQRDAKNFERPDEFIPDRFLPGSELRHNPQAFLAFAPGPRNCIGLRFAMFEMKLCIVRLMKQFTFEQCSETKVPLDYLSGIVVMAPKEAVISLVSRK